MRRRVARGSARFLGVLGLLALLAVPLAVGGHHHATSETARDCSICVVVHLSPADTVAPIALPVSLVSRPAPPAAAPLGITRFDPPAHPGRAPPAVPGGSAA